MSVMKEKIKKILSVFFALSLIVNSMQIGPGNFGMLVSEAATNVASVTTSGTTTNYTTLESAFAAAVNGSTVKLLANCTTTAKITINTAINVTFDGAGYTVTRGFTGNMFQLDNTGATLNVGNVTIDGVASSGFMGSVFDMTNGTLKLTAGAVIQNNKKDGAYQSAVAIFNTSKVYLYANTKIINNTSNAGGGVGVVMYDNSNFYMIGGLISGNNGGDSGGGIQLRGNAVAHLYGGEISGNYCDVPVNGWTWAGGGIACSQDTGTAHVEVGGTIVIKDNYQKTTSGQYVMSNVGGSTKNTGTGISTTRVYDSTYNCPVTLSTTTPLSSGARVGIYDDVSYKTAMTASNNYSTGNPYQVTTGGTTSYTNAVKSYFTSDNGYVVYWGNDITSTYPLITTNDQKYDVWMGYATIQRTVAIDNDGVADSTRHVTFSGGLRAQTIGAATQSGMIPISPIVITTEQGYALPGLTDTEVIKLTTAGLTYALSDDKRTATISGTLTGNANPVTIAGTKVANGSLDNVFIGSTTAANNSSGIAAADANSGNSPSSAVATFARAKALLKAGGTIWVVGPVAVSGTESWDLSNYGTGGTGAGIMKRWDGTSVTFTETANKTAYNTNSMVVPSGASANLTTGNIILDGNSSSSSIVNNGRDTVSEGQIISVMSSAKTTLGSGTTLRNNYNQHSTGYGAYGGAMYIDNAAVVNMGSGVTISNCHGDWGGAVFAASGSTFNMTGGTVTGCSALNTGYSKSASVRTNGGILNLSGGEITGNTGNYAVTVDGSTGVLNLSGTINIHGNTAGGVDKEETAAKVNITGGATVTGNATSGGTTKNININAAGDSVNITGALAGTLGITVNSGNHVRLYEFAKGSSYTTADSDAARFTDDYTSKYNIENTSTTTTGVSGTANTLRFIGYKVTYDGNGNTSGTVPVDANSTTYTSTSSVTVLGNTGTLAKTGYTFGGWNTKADGTGTTYAAGNTFTMGTSAVTLYAKWTAAADTAYKVNYIRLKNDGTTVVTSVQVDKTGTTGDAVNAATLAGEKTYAGYTFNSAKTTYADSAHATAQTASLTIAADGTLVVNLYYVENADVTLTFAASPASTGSVSKGSQTLAPATGIAEAVTASANPGYSFSNWSNNITSTTTTDATLTKAQIDAAARSTGAYVAAAFTANFTENSNYIVAYNLNYDGATNPPSKTGVKWTDTGLLPTAPTRSGHTFIGWFTASDGTGNEVTSTTAFSAAAGNSEPASKTVTLYAKWTTDATINTTDPASLTTALVKKTVTTNPEGEVFAEKTFSFTITPQNGAPAPSNTTGSVSFTQAGTKSVNFGSIVFTTTGTYTYKVTETTASTEGWTCDQTEKTVTVTISNDGNGNLTSTITAALITNSYAPTSKQIDTTDLTNGNSLAVKTVTTTPVGETFTAKNFAFTITPQGDAPAPTSTTGSVSFTAAGIKGVNFGNVTFTKAGTYSYKVTETTATAEGWTCDTSVKDVSVVVTDDGKGHLSLAVTPAAVTNSYAPTSKVIDTTNPASLDTALVKKTVTTTPEGATFASKDFAFTITPQGDAPAPTNTTGSVSFMEAGTKSVNFGTVTFTKAGTYSYKVTETTATVEGWTCDTAVKDVTVVVSDDGKGNLSSTITAALITNSYAPTSKVIDTTNPASLDIALVKKTVSTTPEGATFTAKNFAFTITPQGEAPAPTSTTGSVSFTEAGTKGVNFGSITFTKAGTYSYTVSETTASADGWTCDTTAKTATVVISDDGKGNLTSTITAALITNIYAPTSKVIDTTDPASLDTALVKKTVTTTPEGATFTAKNFAFTIAPQGDAPAPTSTTGSVSFTEAGTKGVNFGTVTFTKAGTYSYKVTETTATAEGWTCDTTEKTATVVISDDGKGNLTPTITGAEIENDYAPTSKVIDTTDPASLDTALVKKTVTTDPAGEVFAEKIFAFTIAPQNGAPAPSNTTGTVSFTQAGTKSVNFGTITFTKAGTYSYKVSETTATAEGWTCDTAVKDVTVEVADDGKGNLSSTITAALITNSYAPTGKVIDTTDPASLDTALVKKTVTTDPAGEVFAEKAFAFMIAPQNGAPAPSNTTGTVSFTQAGTKSVNFGTVTFTKAGTYSYTVSETTTSAEGWTCDTTEKTATVVISDDGKGNLTPTITAAEIENDYATTETVIDTTDPASLDTALVKKTVTTTPEGATFTAKDFAFTITPQGDAPAPTSTTGSVSFTEAGTKGVNFGSITFTKAGEYTYKVSETTETAEGWTCDTTEKTATVVISDDGKGNLTPTITAGLITNIYAPTGKVIDTTNPANLDTALVKKTVTTTPEGATFTAKNFAFTITPQGEAPAPTSTTGSVSFTEAGTRGVNFGTVTFTKAGTYSYTVSETTTSAEGWTCDTTAKTATVVISDDGKGNLTPTITAGLITNIYAPTSKVIDTTDPANLDTALVKKTVTTDPAGEVFAEKTFAFTIAPQGEAPAPTSTTGSVSFTEAGTKGVNFGSITFTKAGTYNYTVSETTASADGWTCDTTSKTATVIISDDGKGNLTSTITAAEIGNSYAPQEKMIDTTDITNGYALATKEMTTNPEGATFASKDFAFTIEAQGDAPVPTSTTGSVSFTEAGTKGVNFGNVTFTKAGTYAYTVSETTTSAEGWTCDTSAKDVSVEVTDDGKGHLSLAVTPAAVTNSYAPTGKVIDTTNPASLDTALVKKTVTTDPEGATFTAKDFAFTITPQNGAPAPSNTTGSVSFTQAGTKGVNFGSLTFTQAGTYTYKVTETTDSTEGWTCDTSEKTVTVKVADDGKGNLIPEITAAEIGNSYAPSSQILDDTATDSNALLIKTVQGTSFKDKEFTFQAEPEGDAPAPKKETATVIFSDAGSRAISFGGITFTKAGTYTYKVKETTENGEGWICDHEDHTAKVKVTDDGKGSLIASVVQQAHILNTFSIPSTPVNKELESVDTDDGILYANYSYTMFNDSDVDATDVRYEDQMVNLDAARAIFNGTDSNGNTVTTEVMDERTVYITVSRLPAHTKSVIHARIPVVDQAAQFSNSVREADNDPGFDLKKVRVDRNGSETEADTPLVYGNDVWFMIRLDNGAGNANLTSDLTKVTDVYGSGLIFAGFGDMDGTADTTDGTITWNPGNVAAGASASIWMHFTVSKNAATEGFAQNKIATVNKTTSVAVPVEHELIATPSNITVTKSWKERNTHPDKAKFQLYVVLADGTKDAIGDPKEASETSIVDNVKWSVQWSGAEIASLSDADKNVISTATVSNATSPDADEDGLLPDGKVGYTGNTTQVGLNNVKGYYVQEVETPDGWTASSTLTVKGGKATYAFTNTWKYTGGGSHNGGGSSGVIPKAIRKPAEETANLNPVNREGITGEVNPDGTPTNSILVNRGLPKTGEENKGLPFRLLLLLLSASWSIVLQLVKKRREI